MVWGPCKMDWIAWVARAPPAAQQGQFETTVTTHLIKFKNILTSPCTVLTAPGHYMTDNRVMFGLPTVPGALCDGWRKMLFN